MGLFNSNSFIEVLYKANNRWYLRWIFCGSVNLGISMKNQSGFSILEVIIVLSVLGFLASLSLSQSRYEADMAKARSLGIEIYEVHNAARKYASLNSANPDLRDSGPVRLEYGVDWLKDEDTCSEGTANANYLSCDHEETTTFGGLAYRTEIDASIDENTIRIKTVIDTKNGGGNTILPEEVLGLAAMTARGGSSANGVSLDGVAASISDPSLTNSSSLILFCSNNIDPSLLNPNCTDINSNVVEGGYIIMITQSSSTSSAWLLTNGGNAMQNNLQFSSSDAALREISGVDRMYNVAGEILKVGNSGIYYDDGSFLPILGDGLVIDTDLYAVGDIKSMGDFDVKGDILTEGSVFVDGTVYTKESIITESDMEVWGNNYVLGQTFINGGASVFGTLSADKIRSNTFVEAREVSANGGVYAGQLVNAPVVRASVNLVSEGDLTVAGDSVVGGNEYVEGNSITEGTLYSGGDLIADTGSSYLNNVFASAIYDNDGTYMVDPSGISRLNIMRADKLAPSTSGGTLSVNSNEILFAAESSECNSASESCATALEGYWDIENLYVKNLETNQWERLVDWMSRIQQLADEGSGGDTDNGNTTPPLGGVCRSSNGGAIIDGIFYPDRECP